MNLRFIISPAKKMQITDDIPHATSVPVYLERALAMAKILNACDTSQLKTLWKCSDALAQQNVQNLPALVDSLQKLATQLAEKGTAADGQISQRELLTTCGLSVQSAAIISYNGIQYQHIAASVMQAHELAWLQEHLRILSGLYGILRPLDTVFPYRLEMQAQFGPAHISVTREATIGREDKLLREQQARDQGLQGQQLRDVYEGWGTTLAQALTNEAKDVHIMNLASQEYAKAITPYVAAEAVTTCLFMTHDARTGRLVQRSPEIKAARGSFIRWCAEQSVSTTEDCKHFADRQYFFDKVLSDEKTMVFVKRA